MRPSYHESVLKPIAHGVSNEAFFHLQVSHILNVAYGVENAFPDLFIYKTLSILDLPDTVITSYFQECAQFIDQAKTEVKCAFVFQHFHKVVHMVYINIF